MQGIYDELYQSLFEIVSFFIRPKQDKMLLKKAGVALDTALFPLMMQIAQHGELGIVELASEVDRDHSTVSRQVDKLVAHGLVASAQQVTDRRARRVRLTEAGAAITDKITTARRAMMRRALKAILMAAMILRGFMARSRLGSVLSVVRWMISARRGR